MAVTLFNDFSPTGGAFVPASNEIAFVFRTINALQPNFQYVLEVYHYDPDASTYGDLIATIRKHPDANTGKGVFVINRILQDYLSYDFSLDAGQNENPNSFICFRTKCYEQYGEPATKQLATEEEDTAPRFAYNGAIKHLDFISYQGTSYLMPNLVSGAASRKFLTISPLSQKIRMGENAWLYYMTNDVAIGAEGAATQKVKVYYSSGATTEFSISNSVKDKRFARLPAGPENLTGMGTIIAATWNNVYKYEIWLNDASGHKVSETRTYLIDSSCTPYETYRLHFLNRMGGFDSFTFKMKNREQVGIKRATFKQIHPRLRTSPSIAYNYNSMTRGTVQHYTVERPSLNLTSDWITDDESEWLLDLISSPAVYIESGGSAIPVTISESSYDIRKRNLDNLFNLEIRVDYSFNNPRQSL